MVVLGEDILRHDFNFDPDSFGWDIAICGVQTLVYLALALGCLMFLQREVR